MISLVVKGNLVKHKNSQNILKMLVDILIPRVYEEKIIEKQSR